METQTIIEYEVVEPVSDESFITRSRDRASEHYGKGWTVFKTHTTITQPTLVTQTQSGSHCSGNINDIQKETKAMKTMPTIPIDKRMMTNRQTDDASWRTYMS